GSAPARSSAARSAARRPVWLSRWVSPPASTTTAWPTSSPIRSSAEAMNTPTAEVVVRGRIVTLEGEAEAGGTAPREVEAIGIAGSRVVAIGSPADVDAAIDARTRVIELAPDEVALPGLTDGHLHLADAAVA